MAPKPLAQKTPGQSPTPLRIDETAGCGVGAASGTVQKVAEAAAFDRSAIIGEGSLTHLVAPREDAFVEVGHLMQDDYVVDVDLYLMIDILSLVNDRLSSLSTRLAREPWNEGLRDAANDLAGFGFVACQRYINSLPNSMGVDKASALKHGTKLPCGRTMAVVVNAAANAWKHEGEWGKDLEPQAQRTMEVIGDVLSDAEYEYMYYNILYNVASADRFDIVVEKLIAWRNDVRTALHSS